MRTHKGRVARFAATLAGLAAVAALLQGCTSTTGTPRPISSASPADPLAPGPYEVRRASYDLGDAALADREYGAPVELAAVVHYPDEPVPTRGRPRPLVMQLHGMWITCADEKADDVREAAEKSKDQQALTRAYQAFMRWPCPSGVPPLPSERGYDYLGEHLASHGFVVVSVRANGVNAGPMGEAAYAVRARLLNAHLDMWRELTNMGEGRLARAMTEVGSGRAVGARFHREVDMRRVGTMGHSRGGWSVMQHAADENHAQWPEGVEVKAVLPLAPVHAVGGSSFPVTKVPFLQMTGTCDFAGGSTSGYVDEVVGRNRVPVHQVGIPGANHNFFNTQWSPRSDQVGAYDDARPYGRPPQPGRCAARDRDSARQLTEPQQRRVALAYTGAFFRRYLMDDRAFDAVLTGRHNPVAEVADIRVRAVPPAVR